MKYWPVPKSKSDKLPEKGEPGSFWEDRGGEFHCGIDIVAPEASEVLAIDSGVVIDLGIFTTPDKKPFWNETRYISIKSGENVIYKYAQLSECYNKIGEFVDAGEVIGKIGQAINPDNTNGSDLPFYLRETIYTGELSMLHLELFKSPISEVKPYYAGNYLGKSKPFSLIDPLMFLKEINGTRK